MPLLLSDVNSCSNDLGRILYANPSEWNIHMNVVDTNTLSNFFTSHTEYQMSLCAIPSNSLTTDIRFFEMWTRFRDVKRLWEQLADLHKKLHLRGSFPQFAEGVIFGNQSAQIVGERTSSITTFLNYVLAHPVLRQSKVLHDYFEKAQEISQPSNNKDVLDPMRQFHADENSAAISLGANMIHVSKYNGQDPKLLFISESENLRSTGLFEPNAQSSATTLKISNPMLNVQENRNDISDLTSETGTSQSYVCPAFYCVTLSQPPQYTQFPGANDDPSQDDYSLSSSN